MINILRKLCKEEKYAAIYMNLEDSSKFVYGRVLAVNEFEIAIFMISPDGDNDGILVKSVEEVIQIEVDSQYSEKMRKLMEINRPQIYQVEIDNEQIKQSILLFARQEKQVVSLEIHNSGYDNIVGFVNDIKNDLCTIEKINDYGLKDGKAYIQLNNVSQISYASQEEIRLLKLWNFNNLHNIC